jgi:hypothetical protein
MTYETAKTLHRDVVIGVGGVRPSDASDCSGMNQRA